MSDYENTYGGAAKDAEGETIFAADLGTQFDNVATSVATKANKVSSPTEGTVATLSASGDLVDSTTAGAEGLILKESSDHSVDVAAGKGEIWLKNDSPNRLMFTDDSGNDNEIGLATSFPTQWIVKTADETVTSSTTMQDDNHLFFTAEAGAVYFVRMHLRLYADSIYHMKWQWDLPDTGDEVMTLVGITLSTSSSAGQETYQHSYGFPSSQFASDYGECHMSGLYKATTGGTATLQWAQATSDVQGHTLRAGSFVSVTRVK